MDVPSSSSSPSLFSGDALPTELWVAIALRADYGAVCAMRQTCHRLSRVLSNPFYAQLCQRSGIAFPPAFAMELMKREEDMRLDCLALYSYNPLASDLGPYGKVSMENLEPCFLHTYITTGGTLLLDSIPVTAPSSGGRGTVQHFINFTEIGVPSWALDCVRPRVSLTVRAYRMPGADGDIMVSARLMRADGTTAVCRKEHQGWFLAGWHAPVQPVEESVEMDFEVYNAGARIFAVDASCSGGGRIGNIEVRLHFPSTPPSFLEEQVLEWKERVEGRKRGAETTADVPYQTSECRMILGVERQELVLRSEATLSESPRSSVESLCIQE